VARWRRPADLWPAWRWWSGVLIPGFIAPDRARGFPVSVASRGPLIRGNRVARGPWQSGGPWPVARWSGGPWPA